MKKLTKTFATLGFVGCAVIASPYAIANDSGWYIGGNVGMMRDHIDDARITSGLLGAGFATTSIVDDDSDVGYKLFGGYKFNKNFALEAGYFNLGNSGFIATVPGGTLNGNMKIGGLNLDAVGILPLTERFSVFGRVGINYAKTKDHFTSTGGVGITTNPNPTANQINPKVGLGFQYNFTESLGMRAEMERYRVDDAVGHKGDIDLVSLGLVYRFGVKKPVPAPAIKAAKSAPIVAAIVQPPVIVQPPEIVQPPVVELVVVVVPPPPPPPPVHIKRTFTVDSSEESFFDFDKATVTPVGQKALDKFVLELNGTTYEVITVTGHTDRIGSPAYNTRLSEHRAEAVKTYLVESSGIPSSKISTKGVGESEPVTKPGECKGDKSKKLIACLAPDRRVEVEVTATRTSK
jgi:OOP family OmpA-OmpF porin